MRLKKKQKTVLLKWIAEGLESGEINKRAEKFDPPFSLSRASITHYRNSRTLEYAAVSKANEFDALTQGLAVKEVRVRRLQLLAALLEKDLFGGFLWLDQVKGVGAGTAAEVVEYEEFNKSEVEAYRGVLDDIAREMGDRKQGMVLSWEDEARKRGYNPDDIRQAARLALSARPDRDGTSGGDSQAQPPDETA